ncbi:MAG: hypothetical protein M3Q56_04525 [Bacteroidota bacterium]|nr:hypothetical protein [Bacteroidota bacterium]
MILLFQLETGYAACLFMHPLITIENMEIRWKQTREEGSDNQSYEIGFPNLEQVSDVIPILRKLSPCLQNGF